MLYYLKVYLCALVGFLAIDLVRLGVVTRGFYRKQLGFLLADQPNWWAAIIFTCCLSPGCSCSPSPPVCRPGFRFEGRCCSAASSA